MSATINLKKQVDLPVYEWLRPLPAVSSAVTALTTANTLKAQYIYYAVGAAFYRYDTISDSWQQLASLLFAPTTFIELGYSSATGHYGQAIAGGAKTIQLAGIGGNSMVGYKIRIISGTGAGQERTITSVAKPVVVDSGVVTAASTAAIIDASVGAGLKQWKVNQWMNYSVRIDFGTGVTQSRAILNNIYNTLNVYDVTLNSVNPWFGPLLNPSTSAGVQSSYTIESNVVTVDTNWDTAPDSSSGFVIMSGGIWAIFNRSVANGSYGLMYYDVLADVWYDKSNQTGNLLVVPTDLSFERFTETGGSILSGAAIGGGTRFLTSSALEPGRYASLELRLTGGTGKGQTRTIVANTSATFYTTRDWDTSPNNTSTFEIYRDCGKLVLVAGGYSTLLEYSQNSDQWVSGKQHDFGAARIMAFTLSGSEPTPITSITRTATGITVLNPTPSAAGTGYLVDQILTITTGGTLGTARITGVNTAGGVLSVALETCGSGYTTGTGKVTTVSPAGGTGCQLDITSVGDIASVISAIAHTAKVGETINIIGTTLSAYNGVKTVIGAATNLVLQYAVLGAPVSPAVGASGAQGTTVLVDVSKNWIVSEHVGKLVQLSTPGPISTGQVRRITANTPTTLTFATATAPVNGTSRYVIYDPKSFGTQASIGAITGGWNSGFATGGGTTSLIDTTKTWPVNYWSTGAGGGRKVRITGGTGAGSEIVITSNTATTLNYASQAFSPDATTRYDIMDNFGLVTSGSTTTLVDTTQNWPVNVWAGKRVRFIAGTGQGQELPIVANTSNTLTFALAVAPDTTTHYSILQVAPKGQGIHLDCITGSTDTTLNSRYLYSWRGGATPELSRYDFTTEQWEIFTYLPLTETLTTGSMFVYDGHDRIYFTKDATGRVMYYDVVKNIIVPSSTVPYGMGAAIIGNRMEVVETEDGLKYLYMARHSGQEFWRTLLFW